VTEGIFAVLYVSIMGLRPTRCYKTTVFLHLYLQLFYCILKMYSIAQNQFQHCETKGRHVGVRNATEISRFFSIYQDGGRRHLGFSKFQFSTVGGFKRVEICRH